MGRAMSENVDRGIALVRVLAAVLSHLVASNDAVRDVMGAVLARGEGRQYGWMGESLLVQPEMVSRSAEHAFSCWNKRMTRKNSVPAVRACGAGEVGPVVCASWEPFPTRRRL